MQIDVYRRYTRALIESLEGRSGVLGLVALGSMAERGETPDDYSDHDFFVIVEPSFAEAFRNSGEWLPNAGRVRLRYRETAHGVKAVYDDGHLIEFAVFTPEEIGLARVNRFRILIDRADIDQRMTQVVRATEAQLKAEAPSDGWLAGQLLTDILVGASRAARGERLSGADRLYQATKWFLRLVERHQPDESAPHRDNLDVLRRVHLVHPKLGAELERSLSRPISERALLLLELTEREIAPRMPEFPIAALVAIRARVEALPRS